MPEEMQVGCARPTGGVLGAKAPENPTGDGDSTPSSAKETMTMIQVGKPAPDFVSPAYHQGKFTQEKLSDHLGKWVVLCLYPGDFTFV
jgi:peroxiredoxin (alkyl hydroperoxide reductase subunit C)